MKNLSKILFILVILSSVFILAKSLSPSTFSFSPQPAYAANDPNAMQLHDDLIESTSNEKWIFTVWRTTLGLADIFVVLVLLFLAIINIAHIQYDTYAIKKSLPLLIIGVIMANFSMLIVRMIVDVAQVLTNTFIGGQGTESFVNGVLCSVAINSDSGLATTLTGPLSLILIILFGILILIGVVVASFLLWIRLVVIYALAAVAPLAFIMLAFPPTAGLFKKWWGWFSQWVFMAPIMMFLFWMASLVGGNNCGEGTFRISAMFLALALVYFACLIPFKMGGAIMSAWGGAGKYLTGTGKDGYARKRFDNWWGRRKTAMGNAAINRIPFVKRSVGASELDKENVENRRKQLIGEGKTADERRKGDKYQRQRMLTEEAERDLKKYQDESNKRISEGANVEESDKIRNSWWARMRYKAQTGATDPGYLAARLAKSTVEGQRATEAVSKSKQWDMFAKLSEDMNLDKETRDQLKGLLEGQLQDIDVGEIEATGTLKFSPDKTASLEDYDQYVEYLEESAELETDPTKKTNLVNSAQTLRNKAQEFRTTFRPTGLQDYEYDAATGRVTFKEGAEHTNKTWTDYMALEDQLRLEAKTVAMRDPEKAKRLLAGADDMHKRADAFKLKYQKDSLGKKINYGAYLDRNLSGRQLKLLTPMLVDEMHTNAQNENINTFMDAIDNGGGFGNIRYMGGKMEKFVQGKYSELSANEINACMSVLGGIKERMAMSPDRSDAQELFSSFLTKMSGGKFLGSGLWKNLLGKLETDRQGSLGQFVLEYSREQKRRGEQPIIVDFEEYKGDDAIAKLNENHPNLIDEIPVEVIGKLVPTGRGGGFGRQQSEFYRRVITQVLEMPEFGGGRNPAMYAGEVRDRKPWELYNTLKPKKNGTQAASSTQGTPSGSEQVAQVQQAEQQAAQFASQSPQQVIQQAGGVDQALNANAPAIRYVYEMRPGMAAKLIDGVIDVDSESFDQILDHIAINISPNIDHAQLQAELERISPNLKYKIDANTPVSTLIENARMIKGGEQNVETLVRESVATDYVPYAQAAPKEATQLNEAVGSLENTLARLESAVANLQPGQSLSKTDIDDLKNVIAQTPPGKLDISKQNILDQLDSGNVSGAADIIAKTLTGYKAARELRDEQSRNSQVQFSPEAIKRAVMAGFEAEYARQKQRKNAQGETATPTPPTPTQPTQQPPEVPPGPATSNTPEV